MAGGDGHLARNGHGPLVWVDPAEPWPAGPRQTPSGGAVPAVPGSVQGGAAHPAVSSGRNQATALPCPALQEVLCIAAKLFVNKHPEVSEDEL